MSYLDRLNNDLIIKVCESLSLTDIGNLHNMRNDDMFSKYLINKLVNNNKLLIVMHREYDDICGQNKSCMKCSTKINTQQRIFVEHFMFCC
jgi:hypothetical protein